MPVTGPVRTCVGCRTARPASTMVRVVRRADGSLAVVTSSAGRGVWVGPGPACLEAASAQLRRALRAEVTPEARIALAASWDQQLAIRGRVAEPPPDCPRSGGIARRGE